MGALYSGPGLSIPSVCTGSYLQLIDGDNTMQNNLLLKHCIQITNVTISGYPDMQHARHWPRIPHKNVEDLDTNDTHKKGFQTEY